MSTPACWSWELPPAGTSLNRWHPGECAVCGSAPIPTPTMIVEDHDHDTELTRGYLCRRCNALEPTSPDPVFELYRQRPPAVILGVTLQYFRAGTERRRPKARPARAA